MQSKSDDVRLGTGHVVIRAVTELEEAKLSPASSMRLECNGPLRNILRGCADGCRTAAVLLDSQTMCLLVLPSYVALDAARMMRAAKCRAKCGACSAQPRRSNLYCSGRDTEASDVLQVPSV